MKLQQRIKIMEEKLKESLAASKDEALDVKTEKDVVNESNAGNAYGLTPEQEEYCRKETQRMADLSPQHSTQVMGGLYIINLLEAENEGKIIVGRLVMNRVPKTKSVNALAETIKEVGMQIMPLVIPGTVADHFGYAVEDFDGNSIPEDKLCMTVVIVDGQTRYSAIRKLRKGNPYGKQPEVFAYFPLNWASLTKMLQAINLKVFTWSNSDFICGLERAGNISDETAKALAFVRRLERQGYNFTAACEWMTLVKGIIRKPSLVKAMNTIGSKLCYDNSEYGIKIHETAKAKFNGDNEKALKNKTVPEFIIDKWNNACNELNKKEATAYIITYLNGLADKDVTETVSPSGYKRGSGKPKADFVKTQLEDSFRRFNKANPFATFKANVEQGK